MNRPPNQTHNTGNGPLDFFYELPPIVRYYATGIFLTTLATRFGILDYTLLMLYWPLVVNKFQVWRLITNFLFIGGFSFGWLI